MNRIGYIISMFIVVPALIIMLILKPTSAPQVEHPEDKE